MEDKIMLPTVFSYRNNGVNNFFNDLLNDSFFNTENWNYAPRNCVSSPKVNILEDEKEYTIEVAAPGLGKKDFEIKLDGDVLTISSRKETKKDESVNHLRYEFDYEGFERSFSLPEDVNADKIKAEHQNGILYVSLPKRDAKPKIVKEIKIN